MTEMDFGQEALKCAYPPCGEAQAQPGVASIPPLCEEHLRLLEFIRFVLARTPIRITQGAPEHGGLTVPTMAPPSGLVRASR